MHNANRPTLSPPSSTCAHWLREATCAAALALALAGLFPGTASAAYILALESDADRTENEVFFLSYSTFEDLVANTNGSGTFGAANISSLFSIAGLAYDGQYRLLLESDQDRTENELFFLSYPTFGDLVANTNGSGTFGAANISPLFSVAGLAYDGQYRLLLESDQDRTENELFFLSYPTFGDLVANTNGSGTFGAANISSLFSVAGLAYDGQYRLLLESDQDRTENELFFLSYPTFEDLVANANGSGTFGAANISSLFSVGGFAYVPPMQPPPPPPPVEVPEPGILTLLAAGLLGIRMKGWRRRRATIETFGPRGDKV